MIEEASNELDKVKFVKVDIDKNPMAVDTFKVESIPTLFVFKDGSAHTSHTGFLPKAQLKEYIERSM